MAARPMDRIFDGMVRGAGSGAPLRRKLVANRDRNWLTALLLHSFSKFAEGAELSDLERSVVDAFRENRFTDDEIKQYGRLERRLPADLRGRIFPERFAQLDVKQSYSMADLERDASGILQSFLAMPTVTQVDFGSILREETTPADYRLPPVSVLREHASSVLAAVGEEEAAGAPAGGRFTLKATSFRCFQRQTDSIFGPANEPYWIFASLGGGSKLTSRSSVFTDVDDGETRTFSPSEGCLWGLNCAAQELPSQVATHIQLWEHDMGDVNKIKAAVAAAFAVAAGILAAAGVTAWISAVVAAAGAAVQLLLGLLDDDHVADSTNAFTRASVTAQAPGVGSSFNLSRRFTDGDGDYSLRLKVTHVS